MKKKNPAGAVCPAFSVKEDPNAPVTPILMSTKEVIAMLGCCRSLWYSMVASGRTPAPVRLGRRTMWRREEILAWVDAGCPARDQWEKMRKAV